jgi:hypothetical protein
MKRTLYTPIRFQLLKGLCQILATYGSRRGKLLIR